MHGPQLLGFVDAAQTAPPVCPRMRQAVVAPRHGHTASVSLRPAEAVIVHDAATPRMPWLVALNARLLHFYPSMPPARRTERPCGWCRFAPAGFCRGRRPLLAITAHGGVVLRLRPRGPPVRAAGASAFRDTVPCNAVHDSRPSSRSARAFVVRSYLHPLQTPAAVHACARAAVHRGTRISAAGLSCRRHAW